MPWRRMSDSLLPLNATDAERSIELAAARIEATPFPARDMWNPQRIPAALLPWLAWSFSVDTWDPSWTEAQKRAAIDASYAVHRQKGTVGAVRRSLAALGLGLDIVEWWQETPKGDPYTFRISVKADQVGAEESALSKIIELVNTSKNLRSHLTSVDLSLTSGAEVYFGGTTLIGQNITVNFET